MPGLPSERGSIEERVSSAYGASQERRWSFPDHGNRRSGIMAERSKKPGRALNFLRAFADGLTLARTDAAVSKRCCASTPELTTSRYYKRPLNTIRSTSATRSRSTREAMPTYCNSSIILRPRMLIRSGSSTTACSNRYADSRFSLWSNSASFSEKEAMSSHPSKERSGLPPTHRTTADFDLPTSFG